MSNLQATVLAMMVILTGAQGLIDPPTSLRSGETPPLLEVRGEQVVLHAAADQGTALGEFLASAREVLGRAVSFNPAETEDVSLFLMGSPSCPRAEFRDFFDRLLRDHGFLSYDAGAPGSDYIVVSSMNSVPFRGAQRMWPRQHIDASRLEEQPPRRTAIYETTFLLTHVDGRAVMATLQPLVNTDFEYVRYVPNSNGLIVGVTSLQALRQMRKLLVSVDVPGSLSLPTDAERITGLEDALAVLKLRLDKLTAGR